MNNHIFIVFNLFDDFLVINSKKWITLKLCMHIAGRWPWKSESLRSV